MAEGELSAVFKALAEDAEHAGGKIAHSIANATERTADIEEANVARTLENEEQTTRSFATIADPESTTEPPAVPGGPTEAPPASNRVRPPREGDTNYVVDNPDDLSDTITDIDRIDGGTLWEEKTATGQDPRINIQSWVGRNVARKLDSYLRARQYLPGYEHAPFGLDFTRPGATPEFRAAVEDAVERWKIANPGAPVTIRWAP